MKPRQARGLPCSRWGEIAESRLEGSQEEALDTYPRRAGFGLNLPGWKTTLKQVETYTEKVSDHLPV